MLKRKVSALYILAFLTLSTSCVSHKLMSLEHDDMYCVEEDVMTEDEWERYLESQNVLEEDENNQ